MINLKTLSTFLLSICLSTGVFAGSGGGSTTVNKMIIGDSIFALSGDIKRYLESDLKETLRSYARSGCQVLSGNLLCSSTYTIPNQWKNSNKSGIKTIIMNGGGNDVLLGDGALCYGNQTCIQRVINNVNAKLIPVFNDMKAKGMTKIVFLGYYYVLNAFDNVAVRMAGDQWSTLFPQYGVTYVDPRANFSGREASYITLDGIHPTAAGSRVLATLIRGKL